MSADINTEWLVEKQFIEEWVLPRFKLGDVKKVEWAQDDEIVTPGNDMAYVPVRINDVQYILIENDHVHDPRYLFERNWLKKYLKIFSPDDLRKLPFTPSSAVETTTNTKHKRKVMDYVITTEDKDLEEAVEQAGLHYAAYMLLGE